VLSPLAARLAEKNGYKNVRVFHAGMPAWKKAGLPALTTSKFVNKRLGYIVVIDTRGPKAAKAGHIQGAVAMPLNQVVQQRDQFPLDKKAYLIFYSDGTDIDKLKKVTKQVSGWGYKNVFILDGGYQGWLKDTGPIQKDMVRTKIFYLPRPHPGEITGDEFMNIVKNKPKDKLILDVRTRAETAGGMLPGAVNIPVDELSEKLKELPKGKEIVTHCRTGLRAEMGYNILRNAGYNARFLNDKVAILQDRIFCCFK
jgi:rhodanese-related sulfurtransferase